jgi:branched-chain amino acid transport system ATP-binding protein
MKPMVSIQNVTKAFGGLLAVNQCSFDIAAGSITGLIGPNGAGKTTLFSMIAGAMKPDSGSIFLAGEDITGTPTHRLFARGLVRTFQIPQEFSRMTVRENLMVVPPGQAGESLPYAWLAWSKVRRQDDEIRRKANEVLDFLQMTHVADELAGNLAGGQKKLLELGRTMMTEVRMVLLDEPGAGVNRAILGKMTDAIRRLNHELGYTFCIIEHDMDVIAKLCYPVIVMAQGRLLARGSMEEIRANADVRDAYLGGHTPAAAAKGAA